MATLHDTSLRDMFTKLFIAFDLVGESRLVAIKNQLDATLADIENVRAGKGGQKLEDIAKFEGLRLDVLLAPSAADKIRDDKGLLGKGADALMRSISAVRRSLFGDGSRDGERIKLTYDIPNILSANYRKSEDPNNLLIMVILMQTALELWNDVMQGGDASAVPARDGPLARFMRFTPPPEPLEATMRNKDAGSPGSASVPGLTFKDIKARERTWRAFIASSPSFDPFVIVSQIFLKHGDTKDPVWLRFYLKQMAASYSNVMADVSLLLSNRLGNGELPRKLADLQRVLPHAKYVNSVQYMPMVGGARRAAQRGGRHSIVVQKRA